jgi:hypothetical protein
MPTNSLSLRYWIQSALRRQKHEIDKKPGNQEKDCQRRKTKTPIWDCEEGEHIPFVRLSYENLNYVSQKTFIRCKNHNSLMQEQTGIASSLATIIVQLKNMKNNFEIINFT